MATIHEKRPGVWEVRVFTGRDERGRATQTSRTVRGTKRAAQRKAAELTVRGSDLGGRPNRGRCSRRLGCCQHSHVVCIVET